MLDLTVEYRPCPGARQGWSDYMARGTRGKRTVPYLVDPNANIGMFESDDIIKYLFNTYGPGEEYIPWTLKGRLAVDTAAISSAIRGNAGYVGELFYRLSDRFSHPLFYFVDRVCCRMCERIFTR